MPNGMSVRSPTSSTLLNRKRRRQKNGWEKIMLCSDVDNIGHKGVISRNSHRLWMKCIWMHATRIKENRIRCQNQECFICERFCELVHKSVDQ